MAAADYRLMTEATGQRIATALENLAGFGSYLTTADVVNNLTSGSTNPVSSGGAYTAVKEKTSVAVTSANNNIVIDLNTSYVCGETLYLYVKGHATADLSAGTVSFFTFSIPVVKTKQAGSVFPLGYGPEWGIDGVTYGYLGDTSISGKLQNGKYFHCALVLLLDR